MNSLDSSTWAFLWYILPGIATYFLHSKVKVKFIVIGVLSGIVMVGGYFTYTRFYMVGMSMIAGAYISYLRNLDAEDKENTQ